MRSVHTAVRGGACGRRIVKAAECEGRGVRRSVPCERTSELLVGGSGDGVAVVATHKHDGHSQRGGKVERSVRIALAGRPLAEEAHRHSARLLQLWAIGFGMGRRAPRGGGAAMVRKTCKLCKAGRGVSSFRERRRQNHTQGREQSHTHGQWQSRTNGQGHRHKWARSKSHRWTRAQTQVSESKVAQMDEGTDTSERDQSRTDGQGHRHK
eukprot:152632-Chlamydomonas_euryale.AAC.2